MDIELLMKECNNYFYRWKETNTFIIDNNSITVIGKYLVGQYIRIEGSIMNDGVYQVESQEDNKIIVIGLTDEVFEGTIYGLVVPKDFTTLSDKIEEYNTNNVTSSKSSEGFNNYSVSYATDKNGKPLQWQEMFKNEIDTYRQAFDGKRWVMEI